MTFATQSRSRIVRDLLWMGAALFVLGAWFVFSGQAVTFVLGNELVAVSIGMVLSAFWVEYRLFQMTKQVKD